MKRLANPNRFILGLEKVLGFAKLYSNFRIKNKQTIILLKSAIKVSWMESCQTLASVSNLGGSDLCLTDRGRRRRSKPTEWFHKMVGSQKNLAQCEKEVILHEPTPTNLRPRRPCSLPRSPKSANALEKQHRSLNIPNIKVS